jgi:hypothetical protein
MGRFEGLLKGIATVAHTSDRLKVNPKEGNNILFIFGVIVVIGIGVYVYNKIKDKK